MASNQWFLRELREELRLTQEEVPEAASILTPTRLSLLERSIDEPTPKERKDVVQAFVGRLAPRAQEIFLRQRT